LDVIDSEKHHKNIDFHGYTFHMTYIPPRNVAQLTGTNSLEDAPTVHDTTHVGYNYGQINDYR